MDKDWRATDKFLRENFWKDFFAKLDKRTTEKQYHTLFQFEIGVQKRRLNQYSEELRPDLYTEDDLVINEQKNLIERLEALYEKFKNTDIVDIEPIELDYGDKNNEILKLLYENLHPNFIKCTLDEFSSHFSKQETHTPIQWYKSETCIVDLFKSLTLQNDDWANIILSHFINKKGRKFKRKQLISVGSDRIGSEYKDSNTIRRIKNEITTL